MLYISSVVTVTFSYLAREHFHTCLCFGDWRQTGSASVQTCRCPP